MAGPSSPSSPSVRGAVLPSAGAEPIDAGTAAATFLVAWVVAQFASFAVLAALGAAGEPLATISIPVLAAGLATTWTVYVGSMWVTSWRSGSGNFVDDYAVHVRPVDALGFPLGVACQFGLLAVVYLPLQALWPETFSDEKVQESAQDLFDRASDEGTLALIAMALLAVVGAPVVEELFYRGLLQHSLEARYNKVAVLVGVALIFAVIHFRPVEYPGLFAFGLVLGACLMVTGRLGMSLATHLGFNAAAVVVVL